MARKRADDAAQLDRALRRRARPFALDGRPADQIEVFTTRIDTIYGATFVLLAPEHPLVEQFAKRRTTARSRAGRGVPAQDRTARLTGEIEKEGVLHRPHGDQPVHEGGRFPIWVANFVLGDYGTGAVMAVPAHDQRDFEFATKYGCRSRSSCSRPIGKDDDGPLTEA